MTVVVIAVLLLVACGWILRSLYPPSPWWMVVSVAVVAVLFVVEGFLALVNRFAWLSIPEAPPWRVRRSSKRLPGWVHTVEAYLGGGLIAWFGMDLGDHWRHVYPLAPGWMPYATMVVWLGVLVGAVEAAVNSLLARIWGQQVDQGT